MGMPPSTFSKWLNGKWNREVTVRALDGLEAYTKELLADLQESEKETQRSEATPLPPSAAGSNFR
jgi:hypothetical protein